MLNQKFFKKAAKITRVPIRINPDIRVFLSPKIFDKKVYDKAPNIFPV